MKPIAERIKDLENCTEPMYFVWFNYRQESIRLLSMSSEYLINVIKMLYDNIVPIEFCTGPLMQFHTMYTDLYFQRTIENAYTLLKSKQLDHSVMKDVETMYMYLSNNYDELSTIPRYLD